MRKHGYTVEWERKAAKAFAAITDIKMKDSILSALEIEIARNPLIGKPLVGPFAGIRSYRFGVIRILYKVYKDRLIIVVLDIAHRRAVYR